MANSKDVVVTGVSTGIGWGTTKVLVLKGFRVFGSVRKQAGADRLQKEFGDGFMPLVMDITDADAVHQAAQPLQPFAGIKRSANDRPKISREWGFYGFSDHVALDMVTRRNSSASGSEL